MTTVMRRSALLLALLLGTAAHAQEPRFADEVDVEVVNVDLVASGEDGAPVADLAAEDFEVLDDGQPVRITHFAGTSAGEGEAQAAPVHLVILFDDAQIQPAERSSAYAGIARQLDRLLGAADRVLVARLGAGLRIVQPFTSDPALAAAALKELESDSPGVPSDAAARKAVLDEIRSGDAPAATALGSGTAGGRQMQSNAEMAAGTSLTSVRAYAERRRAEVLESLVSLDRLASALAGLPGRKAVLLVSPGFDLRPGEGIYQTWLEKYRSTRAAHGSGSVDLERPGWDLRTVLRDLAAGAGANRVAVYAAAPAGGPSARPDPRNVGASASQTETGAGESLHLLTQDTGGMAVFNLEGIERLAESLESDLRHSYSLAYPSPRPSPQGGDGAWHPLEVRVRRAGVRLRAPTGYRARTPDLRTQERAASALLLGVSENPLDIRVDLAEGKRERDGSYTVPVTVKVPLARLMLLPHGSEHEGRLAIFLLTQSETGLTTGNKLEAPVRIANAQMVAAMGQTGAFATSVRLRPGIYRLAVAVRDDVAAVESAVSLELKVEDGKKKGKGKDAP